MADLFSAHAKPRDGRPRDRRQVALRVHWILNTGLPWRDLPTRFYAWATACGLFDKWNAYGILAVLLQHMQCEVEIDGKLWCIDATAARAHNCASGGGNKGTRTSRRTTHWTEAAAADHHNPCAL
ncbi:transposase [Phycisphaerales bacterium AB-hyl4]|uniref:Transposase n=1 Tax=Natronomicrosphaera hydrolytica TaxID=3242702 RepID=A0ABV4UAW5_9BACT